MLDQVLTEIERRERFVLTSHDRADGDAVGSSLACQEILRRMGKQAEVVLRHGVPRVYQQLPFASTRHSVGTREWQLRRRDSSGVRQHSTRAAAMDSRTSS